jgi:hypothetical protein
MLSERKETGTEAGATERGQPTEKTGNTKAPPVLDFFRSTCLPVSFASLFHATHDF